MSWKETQIQKYLRAPLPHDKKFGPYADIAARDAIPTDERYDLMLIGVSDIGGGTKGLYYLEEPLTNSDWILLGTSALIDGSGTTANGNAVDLGGDLVSPTTLRKANNSIYQILKPSAGDDGEFQQFIMSNTEFWQQFRSLAADLSASIGMEKAGAGVQTGGGLYINVSDLAGSANKVSGMSFGQTGIIKVGDIAGSGRAIGTMYDSDYHAKWELLSAAERKRIQPDIEWVELNASIALNTLFVSKGGSNDNIGSSAKPFLTLTKAVAEAAISGVYTKIVILDQELYAESLTITSDIAIIGQTAMTTQFSVFAPLTHIQGDITVDTSVGNRDIFIEKLYLQGSINKSGANDLVVTGNLMGCVKDGSASCTKLRASNSYLQTTGWTVDESLTLLGCYIGEGTFTGISASCYINACWGTVSVTSSASTLNLANTAATNLTGDGTNTLRLKNSSAVNTTNFLFIQSTNPNASFGNSISKSIVSGVLTPTIDRNIVVNAETGVTDDLIEIVGLTVGNKILLRAWAGDTITVKHNDAGATVKILLYNDADIVLDEDNPLELILVDTNKLSQVFDEAGSGAGGHVIQEEGTPLTARANLNFIGASVTATDNAGNDATDVTITGGAVLETRQQLNVTNSNYTDALALNAATNVVEITFNAALTNNWAPSSITGAVKGRSYTFEFIKEANYTAALASTTNVYFDDDIDPLLVPLKDEIDLTQKRAVIDAKGLNGGLQFGRMIITGSGYTEP